MTPAPYDADYIPGSGLPVAPPIERLRSGLNRQVSRVWDETPGTNSARLSIPPASAPGRPVSTKRLAQLQRSLSPRDHLVLQVVAEHRFLSTTQIKRFAFSGHASDEAAVRSARYVLTRLEKAQLIRPLARRVGGFRAGSTAKLWQLAPAGARLLSNDGGNYRTYEPTSRFLSHCLAVADAHLAALDLAGDVTIDRVDVETEPACWRRFSGYGGEARWLRPDLAAVVSSRDYLDHWFIEVDLGTESLPTVLKACGRYEDYRATGIEQQRLHTFPLVCWLFMDNSRADRVRTAIERTARLTPALYRIATPTSFADVLRGGGA